ncbi:MAG TPA: ferredoxin family protein [Verrucomicrobiae bacterium]|nr:ferredoxin family protein [Verrucomicrobiae bacterium]
MRPTAVLALDASDGRLDELPRHLSDAGFDVWLVPNLYHVAEACELWRDLASLEGGAVFLLPLHPRPIEALLRRHGAWRTECLAVDSRTREAPAPLAAELSRRLGSPSGAGSIQRRDASAGARWYPLVDESRCTHCGSCFQFCLFGVYEMDERKKVRIVHPDRCKPGCPACSRICPQGALIFALYDKDPAIAGAPGRFPKPDAAARKMYYARTGLPCPRCGQAGKPAPQPGAPACDECGRPRVAAKRDRDELDALLDGLERLQEGPR